MLFFLHRKNISFLFLLYINLAVRRFYSSILWYMQDLEEEQPQASFRWYETLLTNFCFVIRYNVKWPRPFSLKYNSYQGIRRSIGFNYSYLSNETNRQKHQNVNVFFFCKMYFTKCFLIIHWQLTNELSWL